jgi:hypothetical protein
MPVNSTLHPNAAHNGVGCRRKYGIAATEEATASKRSHRMSRTL